MRWWIFEFMYVDSGIYRENVEFSVTAERKMKMLNRFNDLNRQESRFLSTNGNRMCSLLETWAQLKDFPLKQKKNYFLECLPFFSFLYLLKNVMKRTFSNFSFYCLFNYLFLLLYSSCWSCGVFFIWLNATSSSQNLKNAKVINVFYFPRFFTFFPGVFHNWLTRKCWNVDLSSKGNRHAVANTTNN